MPYDCVVNATPVGMHPNVDESPYDKEHLRPYMVVFDTVYNPENTLLVKEARSDRLPDRDRRRHVRPAGGDPVPHLARSPSRPTQVMRDALKRATASAKQPA